MSSNKKSSTKKNLKLKKGGAFEYAKMFKSSLSPCDKKNMTDDNKSQNGGSACQNKYYNMYYRSNPDTSIRLYNDYSQDWHYPNTPQKKIPYAIDSSAGINEYQFGRTTPNNKFIVATGLVKNKIGIEMTGGAKSKKRKPKSSVMKVAKKVGSSIKKFGKKLGSSIMEASEKAKPVIKKVGKKIKSTAKKVGKKVKPTMNKVVKKVKSTVKKIGKKTKPKTSTKKSKSKSKPSTKKSKTLLNKTKNTLKSVGKKVSSFFSKK